MSKGQEYAMNIHTRKTRIGACAAGLMLASAIAATPVAALGHPDHAQPVRGDGPAADEVGVDRGNPNGSNGTIKLDGIDVEGGYDGHPNNEPHIGCQFEVDMYGFDDGDTAVLEFREWDPTAKKVDIAEPLVSLELDGAGGGIDIDAQELVDLEPVLVGDPHPQHGHHVRLDALITSADGREYTKTKVFWTGVCEPSGSGSGSGS